MNTLEDRLRNDAANQTISAAVSADWLDVVSRSDGRIRRQQQTMRLAVVGFLVLIGLAVVFGGANSGGTVVAPLDLAQPSGDLVQTSSRVPTYVAVAVTWGVSFAIGIGVYFASPRSFRSPYLTERVSRLVATLNWVAFLNLLLAGISGIALTAFESPFLSSLHSNSAEILRFAIGTILFGLFLAADGKTGGIIWLIVISVGASIFWQLITLTGGREFSLTLHLPLAITLASFPLYLARNLNFKIERSRFALDHLRSLRWRQIVSSVLIIGGLAGGLGAMLPAKILIEQLNEDMPTTSGWTATAGPAGSSLKTVPEVSIIYQRILASDAEPAVVLDEAELLELWNQQTTTPLAFDRFRDTGGFVTIRPLEPEPFERNGRFRNLGISATIIGSMILWSETAVKRFTFGPKPWSRRSRRREGIGWIVFRSSALVIGAAGLLPVLLGSSVVGFYAAYLVGSLFFTYIGMRMVTPAPPQKLPQEEGPIERSILEE